MIHVKWIERVSLNCAEIVIQKCSVQNLLLKILVKFTGKHLCPSLFLIKLQAEVSNFIKKRDSGTVDFL